MLIRFLIFLIFSITTLQARDSKIKPAGSLTCRIEPGVEESNYGKNYKGQKLAFFNSELTHPSYPELKFKTIFITVPICDPAIGANKDNCKKDFKEYLFESDSQSNSLGLKSFNSVVADPYKALPEYIVRWQKSIVSYKETQFVTLGMYQYWGHEHGAKIDSKSNTDLVTGIFYEYVGEFNTLGFSETMPKPSVTLKGIITYRYKEANLYWAFSSSNCHLNW